MSGTGFRGPLRYRNPGHYLDGAPKALVDALSLYAGDTEHTKLYGEASEFLVWPGPTRSVISPGSGGWIVDTVDGGNDGNESVLVRDSAQYGILRLLTNDADDDNITVRKLGSPYRYVDGKRMWFHARIAGQDVDDGEIFFGLAIEGDQNPFSTFPTDGLFFEKSETATKMDFHARKNGTSTEKTAIDSSVMADDTMRTYSFHVDVEGNIHLYVDGVEITASAIAAGNANLPDDEDLTPYFSVQTGAAATRYLDIDSYLVAQER